MVDLDTMPAVGGDFDSAEQERRNRLLRAGGGMPPVGPAVPMSSAPPPQAVRPNGDNPVGMPPVTGGPPKSAPNANSGGMPAVTGEDRLKPVPPGMPPVTAMGPGQQKLQQLEAQGPPELHGWKNVLDHIARIFPIGRAIEAEVPGSPGNYGQQVAGAEARAGLEDKSQDRAQRLAQQALAARNTESEINLRDAQGQQYQMTPVKVPWQDEPVLVQKKDAERLQQEIGRGKSAETVAGTKAASAATIEQGKEANAASIAAGKNKTAEQIAEDNRKSREGIASAHNQIQRELQQFKNESPTMASRTMSEMAGTVLKQIPTLNTQIDHLTNALGPAVGRWNQLMVNKGGTEFPEFAGLDTDLDLFASALVRTHFGARGGQQYREELRKQFAEAQTPADLKARIAHAEKWIKGYSEMGNPNGVPAAAGGGGGKPKSFADWKAGQQ